MSEKIWSVDAWEDYLYWQSQDKKIIKRINIYIAHCRGHYNDKLLRRSFPRTGAKDLRIFYISQISPTSSESFPSLKNTGITSRGASAVTVCPPSYTFPSCTHVHFAPAGR